MYDNWLSLPFLFLDRLKNVFVAGKKLFIANGDNSQLFDWDEMGFKMSIPQGSLSESCPVAAVAFVGGKFDFPVKADLVSAVFAVAIGKPLIKPVQIEVQHCVAIQTPVQTGFLSFAAARVDPNVEPPYKFEFLRGGEFFPENNYGCITYDKFDLWLVCILKMPHIIT